jgi:hypothetical protein
MTFLALFDRYFVLDRKLSSKGRFTIRSSKLILAMSVSIYEPVKAALENDDRQYVKDIEADLNKRVDGVPKHSIKDLLSIVNNISSLARTKFWCGILHPEVRSREDKNLLYGLKINIFYFN